MEKVKTIQQFAEENPDKVHVVDSEKLEKANENIKNAIKGKTKKKEKYVFQIVRVFTWRENLGFETHEERHYTDMICDTEETAQDMTDWLKRKESRKECYYTYIKRPVFNMSEMEEFWKQ